ncbi:MAG TPA: hypothetical protein VG079_00110 [Gaiellaceae bacterium]|nr:hypothetical protein [Gaiellaceae bacterium]
MPSKENPRPNNPHPPAPKLPRPAIPHVYVEKGLWTGKVETR